MRAAILLLLILVAGVRESEAHGAAALGYYGSRPRVFTAEGKSTAEEADNAALEQCQAAGLSGCKVVKSFHDTCFVMSLTESSSNPYIAVTSPDRAGARGGVASVCRNLVTCIDTVEVCDTTPVADTVEWGSGFAAAFLPFIVRTNQIGLVFRWTAGFIVGALFLWLGISIVAATSNEVVRARAVAAAWIALPAAIGGALYFFAFDRIVGRPMLGVMVSVVWTDVFGALALGGVMRERFWKREAPPVASLPLAVVAFTAVTLVLAWLFVTYGEFPRIPGCTAADPPSNPCWHLNREGIYVASLILILLVVCGVVLPADSNLVLAYERLNRWVRSHRADLAAGWREGRRRRAEAQQAQKDEQALPDYPVPAIYDPGTVDAMRLKLKRTQRATIFGKMIFMLDARMELTREEFELLRKYRLGESLIYESSARERHREAAQAHLEHSEPAPAWGASIGEHVWSMTKGLFRAGRAVTRMTASSLSLKITINDLIRGKHVECASMAELMSAETAIMQAAKNLRGYLDEAVKFDGREEIIEF